MKTALNAPYPFAMTSSARSTRALVVGFVHRAHVAHSEMCVDPDLVANFAPKQSPDGHAERLADDVPQSDLNPRNRAHANNAQPPEGVLLHHANRLFDVARITPEHQGL